MIGKVLEALKAGSEKKKHETSRINLDAELEAVRAKIDADLIAKEAEERKTEKAGNGAGK